jgi:hypothetical protein
MPAIFITTIAVFMMGTIPVLFVGAVIGFYQVFRGAFGRIKGPMASHTI